MTEITEIVGDVERKTFDIPYPQTLNDVIHSLVGWHVVWYVKNGAGIIVCVERPLQAMARPPSH